MIIHVDSIKNLESGISCLFDTNIENVYEELKALDWNDIYGKEIDDYIKSNQKYHLDSIFVSHLTRKFDHVDTYSKLLPLNLLVTSDNPFNLFLKKYEIEFAEINNYELQLVYRGIPKTISGTPNQYECESGID